MYNNYSVYWRPIIGYYVFDEIRNEFINNPEQQTLNSVENIDKSKRKF